MNEQKNALTEQEAARYVGVSPAVFRLWRAEVQGTAARMSQETVAAKDMIARFAQWQGREPDSVAADATYGNGEFLQWLMERGVTPYMRTRDSALRTNSSLYGPERFTYLPESNSYLCPAGEQLNYGGHSARNRTHVWCASSSF
jgi:hypothetical protein